MKKPVLRSLIQMICIIIKNSIIRMCNISSRMGDQGKPDFSIGKISTKFKFSRQKIFRFDHVTCRGCCGCYGWDNFDPKAVSESLKQMLQMRKKIIALSQSWQEWQPAENRPRKPLFWEKTRFLQPDHMSCRGCYGWTDRDIFNPSTVSGSSMAKLRMKNYSPLQLSHEPFGGRWKKGGRKHLLFINRKGPFIAFLRPMFRALRQT